jgi:tRNA threonylcarbamoyladenosine biosynthesis protein TsaB
VNWLALDTATDRVSVAVGSSATDVAAAEVAGARRHAAALPALIADALRSRGLGLTELQGVLLADGPGSFTGLRVGAAVAKALCAAQRVTLGVAPSLMAVAYDAAGHVPEGMVVMAVSNALRGDVYAASYRFLSDRVEVVQPPAVVATDRLLAGSPPALVAGELPDRLAAQVSSWAGASRLGPVSAPRAAGLLGLRRLAAGISPVTDPARWEPTYGRPAEAQARWENTYGRPLPDSHGAAG